LTELVNRYDAVFLSIGLAGVNDLGIEGEHAPGVENAVDFISALRQAQHSQDITVRRNVVVIGGGMTAVDAAVQTRLLGSENVTIAYRRGLEEMNASEYEQELAKVKGVVLKTHLQPLRIHTDDAGNVCSVEFEYTRQAGKKLVGTGETTSIAADCVFKAIGQNLDDSPLSGVSLQHENGKLRVDARGQTSNNKIWAGGDCVVSGEDLTVSAVQDGKVAAESIHQTLMG